MIYKRLFRALTLLLSIVMMIGVCGCMEQKKVLNIDDCLKYMTNKYGEEFSYLDAGVYQSHNTMTIYVENAAFPNSRIYVLAEVDGDTIVYKDNYLAVKYKQEKNDLFEKVSKSVFNECRIIDKFEEESFLSESFSGATSFKEYFSDDKSKISMVIIVPSTISENVFKEKIDEVVNALVAEGFAGTVNLYLSKNEDAYKKIEKDDIWNTRDWFVANCQIQINSGGEVEPYFWR